MNLMTRLAAALALTLAATGAQAANVLVVLSDENHLDLKDGKVLSTGFYLNELMQPVKLLLDAGHEVTFATPQGRAPTVDASSVTPAYFGNDAAQLTLHKDLLEKLALTSPTASPVVSLARVEQEGYGHFDAVYIPGGHAPMQDLLKSPALGRCWPTSTSATRPPRWSATGRSRCCPRCRMRVVRGEAGGRCDAGYAEVDLQRLPDDGDQQPGRRAGQADAGRR